MRVRTSSRDLVLDVSPRVEIVVEHPGPDGAAAAAAQKDDSLSSTDVSMRESGASTSSEHLDAALDAALDEAAPPTVNV